MLDKDIRICPEYSNEELGEIIKERERKMPGRENVINEINELLNNYPVYIPEAAKRGLSDALALLKEQEAVVRCEDCKKRHTHDCFLCFTHKSENDDWYCADGERK